MISLSMLVPLILGSTRKSSPPSPVPVTVVSGKKGKNEGYYASLEQWLERSDKDDAMYAKTYATFKPFQDDFSALSMPPTDSKSHTVSDTDSSSGSSSCSPPSDSQSLSVMHRDGLISGTSLASPASPHKPLGTTGANSIAKTNQSAGTTSKSTRKTHAKVSKKHTSKRQKRPSHPRATTVQRNAAASKIQRAYLAHLERIDAIMVIVDEVESVVHELRSAIISECKHSKYGIPSPFLLQVYSTAMNALALRLITHMSSLPPHVRNYPSLIEENEEAEAMLRDEFDRVEEFIVCVRVTGMRERLQKRMEECKMCVLVEEDESEA